MAGRKVASQLWRNIEKKGDIKFGHGVMVYFLSACHRSRVTNPATMAKRDMFERSGLARLHYISFKT